MEWILIAVLTLATGYKMGEAGAKREIQEKKEVCVQHPTQLGVDECYTLVEKDND